MSICTANADATSDNTSGRKRRNRKKRIKDVNKIISELKIDDSNNNTTSNVENIKTKPDPQLAPVSDASKVSVIPDKISPEADQSVENLSGDGCLAIFKPDAANHDTSVSPTDDITTSLSSGKRNRRRNKNKQKALLMNAENVAQASEEIEVSNVIR